MDKHIVNAGLGQILEKVKTEERLSLENGRQLYESDDILALGYLANIVRNRVSGDNTYYSYNQHINYSNICKFCAFGCQKDSELAYEMNVEEVKQKVLDRLSEPITEIHMAGSRHPDLSFEYHLDNFDNI